jgi:thiamine pyrophosphokinase
MFDVRAEAEGPVLATLDRGAVPAFGVIGQGVHLNGLVRRADGLHVWVGIRARDKAVAPGQLDNLVAGGIPAGLDAETTLLKEAGEEASLPESLARQARRVGRISYVLVNAEGLRRDVLHCFDLDLPEDFTPRPNDDEVERFELWPAARLLEAVRHADSVKFNVNLVLIDLFLREGMVAGEEAAALRAGLQQGP